MQTLPMMPVHVRLSTICSSQKREYDLGDVGRYSINKKVELDDDMDVRVLTKEDIIELSISDRVD